MVKKFTLALFSVIVISSVGLTKDRTDDVHLFQSFYRDATIASNPYGEAFANYGSYEYGSAFAMGVQGGFGVTPALELNGNLGYSSFSPEHGDGVSGLTDLTVAGRYLLHDDDGLRIAAGGLLTAPIGAEEAGYGKLNFGAFGATRYTLPNAMVITGTIGLDFYETITYTDYSFDFVNGEYSFVEPEEKTEYKNSLVLAGGLIYPQSDQLAIIGEILFKTDVDYGMLSAGVDYRLQANGHVRGAVGFGLDDGAPDLLLMLGYLMSF
ncbi:transporter [candidate division KSB1 bacterium]|nr:transporter [candidate division KSB1 bacterium]RQW06317.1 MAG: hypothetical protein EH222_08915 [candidate division KSB1 bacterium]